jgi:septum formation protein
LPIDSAARLILASGSPRREELLRLAGFTFSVVVPTVQEDPRPGEAPEVRARRLADAKAEAILRAVRPDPCVLGADTLVVVDEEVLGKPRDVDDAVRMLLQLANRTHRVLTGFALMQHGKDGITKLGGVEESRVRMIPFSREAARAYAETGEPLDKAGAYAVQGLGGQFVEAVEGSRSNVIGLPLERVVPLLAELGVHPP